MRRLELAKINGYKYSNKNLVVYQIFLLIIFTFHIRQEKIFPGMQVSGLIRDLVLFTDTLVQSD